MMKKVLIALAVLAVSVLPSFAAADSPMPGTTYNSEAPGVMQGMQHHPEMKREMMRNPQHQLMRAYHKNLMIFGRALANVAQQGETVPPDFARTTIAEMKRSTEQMEKYRAGAMAGMPAGMKDCGDMQKMMDEHLVTVKTHLSQLEDLAKADRIQSRAVLDHLQPILGGCDGGSCDLGGKGMHRRNAMHDQMMPQHRQMMQEMTEKLKAQDAELVKLVERMKQAPRDKKVDLLADIVDKMVQQRAAMTMQMEKMQKEGMRHMHHQGASVPPPPDMRGMGHDSDDYEADTDDDDSMNMNDMDMDD